MRVRVFQLVSAVAEFDQRTGRVDIMHGDNLTSMLWDSCGWRGVVERLDIEQVRAEIAAHLNACPAFRWPLLPTITPKPPNIPALTARDVLPGDCSNDNRVMRFGVIADDFEITEGSTDAL